MDKTRKLMMAATSTIVAIMMTVVMATPALAASSQPTIKAIQGKTTNVMLLPKEQGTKRQFYYDVPSGKLTGLKTSNKKVATAKQFQAAENVYVLIVTAKRPGRATISYTWNGKVYKAKFVVRKWTNPVASFKVGTVEFGKKYAKSYTVDYWDVSGLDTSKMAGKRLTVKPSSGWQVVRIRLNYVNGKAKTVKNGAKITSKNVSTVNVTLKNKKTGCVETLYLQ